MTVMTTLPSASGLDDTVYIRRLRELIGDIPRYRPEQISGVGTASTYQLQQLPIEDDVNTLSVTVGGVSKTVVTSRMAVGAGKVFIDFDTGLLIFGDLPPVGTNNIVVTHNTVRWRNITLLSVLLAGLRAMFPKVWQDAVDTSLTVAVNQWDYSLPPVFADPRVKLFSVEVREIPAQTERYRPLDGWRRVGLTTLQIPGSQRFTPGASLRLHFAGPYRSLGELDPQLFMLPIWYAAGTLMAFREEKRARTDTQNVAAGEQANPPMYQQNAGSWFMKQFQSELNMTARPLPFGHPVMTASL